MSNHRFHSSGLALLIAVACLCEPSSATARETDTLLPARAASESEQGLRFLLPVPFFMQGEPHLEIEEELGTAEASRASSGAFRSDRDSCNAAFLDALKVLQQSTLDAGGNALVDVVSTTRGVTSDSPTDFRCVAGAAVVHVGLRGRMVRIAK